MYMKKLFSVFCLALVISFEVKGAADGSSTSTESDVEQLFFQAQQAGKEAACGKGGKERKETVGEASASKETKALTTAQVMEQIENRMRQWTVEYEKRKTPLSLAAAQGNAEKVRLLVGNRANIDEKDEDGLTPLMQATLAVTQGSNA